MNLDHLQAIAFVQKLAWSLKDAKHDFAGVEVAVFPPFTDLRTVQTLVAGRQARRSPSARRTCRQHDSGAYTGEISGAFLAALDCSYVIIGHSERRTLHGETDEVVAAKVAAALKHGLVPIICVGETAEDLETARPERRARRPAARRPSPASPAPPTSSSPTSRSGPSAPARPRRPSRPSRSRGAARRARRAPRRRCGREATRILYGGSVKAANIAGFMREPNVDGALVGGASLDVDEFASIARFQKHVGL